MKKTVKSLIIAASVAAIAGIGAVSFAAWEGTGSKTVTSNANPLGTVTLVGFDATTADAWEGTLVPYNQPESTIVDDGVTVTSITLPKLTAVAGQTITVKAEIQDYTATDGKTNKLYVFAQKEGVAPTANAIVTAAKEANSTGVVVATVAAAGENETVYTLYFALDSNDLAAREKEYNITVTLSDPA